MLILFGSILDILSIILTLVEYFHFILAGCCNVISEVDAISRFQKECLSKFYIVYSWVHVHLLYTLSMHTNITH